MGHNHIEGHCLALSWKYRKKQSKKLHSCDSDVLSMKLLPMPDSAARDGTEMGPLAVA